MKNLILREGALSARSQKIIEQNWVLKEKKEDGKGLIFIQHHTKSEG